MINALATSKTLVSYGDEVVGELRNIRRAGYVSYEAEFVPYSMDRLLMQLESDWDSGGPLRESYLRVGDTLYKIEWSLVNTSFAKDQPVQYTVSFYVRDKSAEFDKQLPKG